MLHGRLRNPKYVLNITNVYFPVIGGISTYVRDLANGLVDKSFKVEILVFPVKCLQLHRFIRWIIYLWFIAFILLRVFLLRMKRIIPVVHSHSASFCLVTAVMSKWLFGVKAFHTFHSPLEKRSWVLRKFTPFLDRVIYVSSATRELYRRFDVPPHPDEAIIPGGIRVSDFPVPFFEKRFSLQPPHIMFVGRICKEKGVREAVEAVALMKEEAQIDIVGLAQTADQKEYLDGVKGIVEKSEILKRRVHFLGKLTGDPLKQAYTRASIFICPSVWEEPAPMVIPEAMAAGIPVVAFDTGGLRERIRNEEDGLLVPNGNVEAFAQVLDALLRDKQRLEKMSRIARRRAETDFDLAVMVGQYIELYQK